MKTHHLLIAAPILFLLGIFAGRELFPLAPEPIPDDQPRLSQRAPQKRRQPRTAPAQTNLATATDIPGLLALVDLRDAFNTSTRLRASLQNLSPGDLTTLCFNLAEEDSSHPGFYTLRLSILNHLVAKDPFQALDMILALDDRNFQNSSISIIMQGLARLGTDHIQQALALIQDPQLKQYAQNIALAPTPDSTPDELLALLKSGSSPVFNYSHSPVFWNQSGWGSHYSPWNFSVLSNGSQGALSQLAQKDLASAESYVLSLKTKNDQNVALLQIANGLAQKDPDYALDWARSKDSQALRDQSIISILATLAAKDPARAAGLIDEIENLQSQQASIAQIASQWAMKDPQAAITWAKNLPPTNARLNAYRTIAQQLAQSDPQAAIRLAETLPGQTRKNLMPNLINQWAAKDFDGARAWVTSQKDPVRLQQALSGFMSSWTQKDPSDAASFLEQTAIAQPNSKLLQNQFAAVAQQWAAQDRDAAMAWASSLQDKNQRDKVLTGIHSQWTSTDPASAAQHLATVSDPDQRQQLLSGIASSWASQDPQAAEAWLGNLSPDERFSAAGSAISSLQSQHPQFAAQLYDRLTTEAGNDEKKMGAINHYADDIASNWAVHSPQDAAEWAAGIADEANRTDAFGDIASRWADFDPTGAALWIDSLPDGKPRDEATRYFVQDIRRSDPATAIAWADTISDDSTRFNSLRDAVNALNQSDPEAAREAANNANLSTEKRDDLLRQLR